VKGNSPIVAAVLAAMLIVGGWALLLRVKERQHLGVPGIKTQPVPTLSKAGGVIRTNSVYLPADVPGYNARRGDIDDTEWTALPPDTVFGRMLYEAPQGNFTVQTTAILMGADRTSIHQPEFCLKGNGWNIQRKTTETIPFDGIRGGTLDVRRFDARSTVRGTDGRVHEMAAVYVFWFVADDQWTASHWTRTFWMTRDLLTQNVLQRWGYISYFALCPPGQESGTYEKICNLIRSTAPRFQIAGIAAK